MPNHSLSRSCRNVVFLLMLGSIVFAYRAEVYAWDDWDSLCSYWTSNYDCTCSGRYPDPWAPEIRCDFSQEEDWSYLFLLLDADAAPRCDSICESHDYKMELYEQQWGPCNDPVCEEWADNCYDTWGQYSSEGSESDSWARCVCHEHWWCPWK